MIYEEQIAEQIIEVPLEAAKNVLQPQQRQTVLIVDDEAGILTSMTALLEDDFVVLTSPNPEKALALLEHSQVSVIIADQRMPGLTGDEFLAKAKILSEATRILITGYADINALIRAVNHGQIYSYIAKPWEPADLRLAVIKAAEHCLLSKEVERERSLLHALMNNIPDAIWFKDNACRFTQVNKAAASLLGVSEPSEVIGKTTFDFLSSEQANVMDAQEKEIIQHGRSEANKIEEFHFNGGGARWVSTTRAPVLERMGGVAAIVGVSRDVTEQRRAEIALQQSENKFRQIVETAAEGVWILDDHLRTSFVNQAMAAMLGYKPEDMAGKVVSHFMQAEDAPVQLEQFERTNSGRGAGDLRLLKSDGTLAWAMLSSSPMIDASGHQNGTLAMLSDVTLRRELEHRFLQAQKMEVVGRLAAGIAHDFNNLLTVINTYSQLLLGRFDEQHPAWREIHEIQSAGERSAILTQRLLAIGRQSVQQPKLFDLNLIIAGLQHMLSRLIGEEIRLTMRLNSSSPIETDQGQIEHLVMNLCINARDAMSRGGELVVATANRRFDGNQAVALHLPPGEYVELTVTDTGHGMDEQTKARIFEAFFTTKEIGKGTGLGLWMAREIVQRSQGNIVVDSIPGQGSSFRIYLPLASKQIEPVAVASVAPLVSNSLQTVLVIEEDLSMRQVIKTSLATAGYKVLFEGEREVASLTGPSGGVHIDLLISGSGTQWRTIPGARLAAGRPSMRTLVLVNGDEVLGDEEPCSLGVAYLQKPFQPADLIQRVRNVLDAPSEYRILIADDDPAIRSVLRDVLRPSGYRVVEASDGIQAIAQLRAQPVDLMITDLVMPGQEGLATIRAAKKEFPTLNIIAMSGGFGESYLEVATLFGADELLCKPFRLDALREMVRRFAHGSKVSAKG